MYLDQLKTAFEISQMVPPQLLKPCTEEEVQHLEQTLGLRFPQAYREFLLWIGHGAGGFLAGYDWTFKNLFDLRDAALELLEENRVTEVLPKDAMVFFMNQGYRFLYFCTSDGEDPPVYEYSEDVEPRVFRLVFRQFSAFLVDDFEITLRHFEKVKSDIRLLLKTRPKLAEKFILFERARGYNL